MFPHSQELTEARKDLTKLEKRHGNVVGDRIVQGERIILTSEDLQELIKRMLERQIVVLESIAPKVA